MKLFVKLMLAALVLALLLPFTILKNDQGQTLMRLSDFNLPDLSIFSSGRKLIPSSSESGDKDFFYKWYDADGNVQFTTEPPDEGIEYTIKGYDPNTNVIQAVKPAPVEIAPQQQAPTGETASVQPGVNAYDPESVKKLMEDAKNIEKLLNQRYENLNSDLNQ
jgi:hypothetical protein